MKQAQERYKPRYNGRVKKRQWEDFGSEGNPEKRANFNPEDRVKRKKFCLLLGYSGANYFGMTFLNIYFREWMMKESFVLIRYATKS